MLILSPFPSQHSNDNPVANGWRISRLKFFMICFAAMFVYYWLPGILLQCVRPAPFSVCLLPLADPRLFPSFRPSQISYFNWINWINPQSVAVAAVFGTIGGLSLNPIPTLDWSQFYGTTVMVQPFFSTLNQFIGMLISGPVILGCVSVAALPCLGLALTGPHLPRLPTQLLVRQRLEHVLPAHDQQPHRESLPCGLSALARTEVDGAPTSPSSQFDNTGGYYNVSMILDDSQNLDVDKYKAYSEP